MKISYLGGIGTGLAAAALALPAVAHHSAAQFDFSQTVMIEGTVKVIDVRNPHIKLILEVADDAGTREIAPLRDGSDGGYVTRFELSDGTRF